MKAAIHTSYGGPDVVSVQNDIPKPVPKNNEILIKVHATTLNRTDCGFRAGTPFIVRLFSGLLKPKYPVLGCEFAGVVAEIGSDVARFKVGDKVFGFDDAGFGGHGEFMTIKQDKMIGIMPKGMPFSDAAAMLEGSHYALSNITTCGINKDSKVLINGATGAIGSAALQIVASIGANVTATCNTQSMSLITSLGADEVINYEQVDFTQQDKEYDVVLDTTGKSNFQKARNVMAPKGVYISSEIGPFPTNPVLAIITKFTRGKRVMFPIPRTLQSDVELLTDLYNKGEYKPLIQKTYTLDYIVEATKFVETGEKIGNVVITVVPEKD